MEQERASKWMINRTLEEEDEEEEDDEEEEEGEEEYEWRGAVQGEKGGKDVGR